MDILVYAVIAFFIAYRLYTVLGQRGEDGRQRPNPFSMKPPASGKATGNNGEDNLLSLPLPKKDVPRMNEDPAAPFAADPAPQSLAGGLHAIHRADPAFDEREFLKGARVAFEMIVYGFAAGERGTLKNLLGPALYKSFEADMDAREARGERYEMKTLALRDADIVNARMIGREATIDVQFISDQAKAVYDKDGQLLHDPGRSLEQITDRWRFQRDTSSRNPNWQLTETLAG
jgi:predicted lipid-binding transport protein (Tim44 family)